MPNYSNLIKPKKSLNTFLLIFSLVWLNGCATLVNQDEVGVRTFAGKYSSEAAGPGVKLFLWPLGSVKKISVQTQNLEVKLKLPSQEGLNVAAGISIAYR